MTSTGRGPAGEPSVSRASMAIRLQFDDKPVIIAGMPRRTLRHAKFTDATRAISYWLRALRGLSSASAALNAAAIATLERPIR